MKKRNLLLSIAFVLFPFGVALASLQEILQEAQPRIPSHARKAALIYEQLKRQLSSSRATLEEREKKYRILSNGYAELSGVKLATPWFAGKKIQEMVSQEVAAALSGLDAIETAIETCISTQPGEVVSPEKKCAYLLEQRNILNKNLLDWHSRIDCTIPRYEIETCKASAQESCQKGIIKAFANLPSDWASLGIDPQKVEELRFNAVTTLAQTPSQVNSFIRSEVPLSFNPDVYRDVLTNLSRGLTTLIAPDSMNQKRQSQTTQQLSSMSQLSSTGPNRHNPQTFPGLKNYGYTCYLNAIFNALAWNPRLNPNIQILPPCYGNLAHSLVTLLFEMRTYKKNCGKVIGPFLDSAVTGYASKQGTPFEVVNQYTDCAEVLHPLLDTLFSDYSSRFYQVDTEDDTFTVAHLMLTTMLSLDIGERREDSLHNLLLAFQEATPLPGSNIKRRLVLMTPGETLCCELKRGQWDKHFGSFKKKHRIILDPHLTLAATGERQFSEAIKTSPWRKPLEGIKFRYQLRGAIVHIGDFTESGHFVYVSLGNEINEPILVHNDEMVCPLEEFIVDNVPWDWQEVEKNAVLVFYQREISKKECADAEIH